MQTYAELTAVIFASVMWSLSLYMRILSRNRGSSSNIGWWWSPVLLNMKRKHQSVAFLSQCFACSPHSKKPWQQSDSLQNTYMTNTARPYPEWKEVMYVIACVSWFPHGQIKLLTINWILTKIPIQKSTYLHILDISHKNIPSWIKAWVSFLTFFL